MAKVRNKSGSANTRINPQLSCTIAPDDVELLKQIRMRLINKHNNPAITQSDVIRGIIRLANKNFESIEI